MSFTVSGFNVGGSGVGAAVGVGVAVQDNAISTISASDMEVSNRMAVVYTVN